MINLSEEQKSHLSRILSLSGPSVLFITGSAGTGKSTLLHAVQDADEDTIVLAPTGVAALRARGQTIHSFFGLGIKSLEPRMTSQSRQALISAKRLIIDEVSMVRADLMQLINTTIQKVMKNKKPFGGLPLILFGDLNQIEPVAKENDFATVLKDYDSHFFFDAPCIKDIEPIEILELTTVYRQKDDIEFIEALQAVKVGRTDKLDTFNKRINVPDDETIRICYTNRRVAEINDFKLHQLEGKLYSSNGTATGDFSESEYPTEAKFLFKVGARVMLLVNKKELDSEYVNGDLGEVVDVTKGAVIVRLDRTGGEVAVTKNEWEKIIYEVTESGKVKAKVVGTYKQLPMRLAYATSVHKVQGTTFHDKVHLELESKTFAHGLLYVALSRATKLENLTIGRRIHKEDILIDDRVADWCSAYGI
jgi:ATP-dependent DNA helicase PIF1